MTEKVWYRVNKLIFLRPFQKQNLQETREIKIFSIDIWILGICFLILHSLFQG